MRWASALAVGALLLLLPAGHATAAGTSPKVRLTRISPLTQTTAMATRPGDATLYVTRQSGEVRAIRGGKTIATPVVDLTALVSQDGGERGLLGLVFSPDATKLYVDYTDRAGNPTVDELTMQGRTALASSRRTVIKVPHPFWANHNGGQLAFGPDGDLYIGVGDGGSEGDVGAGHAPGGNGQSLGTLLGKILRIDPAASGGQPYTVPADNPFVGTAGARPEIWAYGLRNPWRFSFDRDGSLWIADVGQDEWEEIDHVPAVRGKDSGRGDNFGWDRMEGDHHYTGVVPAGVVDPVYEYSHAGGGCAVVGGFVYRGRAVPALAGDYLFSDNCESTIRAFDPRAGRAASLGVVSSQVSSFGRDAAGHLFVLSLDGGVFRVDPTTA